MPNGGFEKWYNPNYPEDTYITRSAEQFGWYATSPYAPPEGSRYFGMQVRTVSAVAHAELRLTQGMWIYWNNPTNLTLSFNWLIDSGLDPSTEDALVLTVQLAAPGVYTLHYFLNPTSRSGYNSSTTAYIRMDATPGVWNAFNRNITADFFDAFGKYPVQFATLEFRLANYGVGYYSRSYLDDLRLVNGTTVKIGGSVNNGNFESTGSWNWQNWDPSDISRTDERKEGQWALNSTTISNGNASYARVQYSVPVRLSTRNPDVFSLWWVLDEWQYDLGSNYAHIIIDCSNSSGDEFELRYVFCRNGIYPFMTGEDRRVIEVEGYNTTGQWRFLSRSIWEDVTDMFTTRDLIIDGFEVGVSANGKGTRLCLLLDNITLTSASLNDLSYEDQGTSGDLIRSWSLSYPSDYLTVTNTSHYGNWAANLTVVDSSEYYGEQSLARKPLNSFTDTFLDLWWRIEEFSGLAYEEVYLQITFGDSEDLALILANGSTVESVNGWDEYLMALHANEPGTWNNLEVNMYDAYSSAFGHAPDTTVDYVTLIARSAEGGRIKILFDDVYVYDDPAPDISNVGRSPENPEAAVPVTVTAEVYDPSIDTVLLHYRADGGSWSNLVMTSGNLVEYSASIPGQMHGVEIEYFVSANDTFHQASNATDDGDYFSYTSTDTTEPLVIITSPVNNTDIARGSVAVAVAASDAGSGIQHVDVYINGTKMWTDTTPTYHFVWDTTDAVDGVYIIRAVAYDNAGHSSQTVCVVSMFYPPSSADLLFIVVIGAVVLVVLFVALRAYRLRTKT